METPPPQRSITEGTPIKLPIGRLVALVAGIVTLTAAASAWLAEVHRDVRDLKSWTERCDARLKRLEDATGARAATPKYRTPQP